MSRKLVLTIATAATVAVASLASQSADAHGGFGSGRGFGGGRGLGSGGFGGGGGFHTARNFHGLINPHPIHPIVPIIPVHLKPIIPHFPLPKLPFPSPTPPPGGAGPNHHWAYHNGQWSLEVDLGGDVELAPAVVTAPAVTAPAQDQTYGCLTKTYTPTALVVFADICTGESASAPVNSTADATQAPTSPVAATATPITEVPTTPNYAGRTYEDYLAANPQFAQPQAANTQP